MKTITLVIEVYIVYVNNFDQNHDYHMVHNTFCV